jgi:hypothetical protein
MEQGRSVGDRPGAVELRLEDHQHTATAVVKAVSEATDTPVSDIDVELNDVVDPDALDRLFAVRYDGTPRRGGTVSFEMYDCEVIVEKGGRVVAVPLEA